MTVKFEDVCAINVNEYVEQKGNLNYLSWANAWREFKKVYPDAKYEVKKFNGLPYVLSDGVGAIVYTEVTVGEQTYEMWLPVMDGRNNTILSPKMTEINKTIMRCLTKNLAMFGLGLYIYAGEDLPDDGVADGEEQNASDVAEKKKPAVADKAKTRAQNKPKSTQEKAEKPKTEPITKAELVQKWGVREVEKTVQWFERQFGLPMKDWGEEEIEGARGFLEERKAKRDAETAKMREGLQTSDADLPFPTRE